MNAAKRNTLQATARLIVIIIMVGLIFWTDTVHARPDRQTNNLLANPGFEPFTTPEGQYDYPLYVTSEGGGHIAENWSPWWYNDEGPDYMVPEYDIAPISRDPVRVRSGNAAQQIFRPSVLWLAGVYQRVQVPANAQLRFTIYGHAWAGFCKHDEGGTDCGDNHDSFYGDGANPATMKIGIDPTGGTNWASESIVWSQDYAFYDQYQQLLVDATAQGEFVTVYTYTTFLYPAVINNVYWDDASLTMIGEGTAPTSTPAPSSNTNTGGSTTGGSSPGVIVTQPPRDDGSQWHVVQPGDTLGGIAVAYGTRSQTIRELNSLTSDVVRVGQELLIKPAEAPEPAATPTVEVVEEQPTAIAEVQPEEQLGSICMLLYEDANQNGLRDPDEMPLANGTMNLSGEISDSYTTDGVSEPHCFSELVSGNYVASVIPPMGYHLTMTAELPVTITGGGQVALNFGAAGGEEVATSGAESVEEEAASPPSNASPIRTILIVAGIGIVLLAVGGGLTAYFLIYKGKAAG